MRTRTTYPAIVNGFVDTSPELSRGCTDAEEQVYAVVVGSLSAISSLIYMIPIIIRLPLLFIWDTILFIFWIAVFGVFGKLYIHTDAQGDSGIQRMKNAVWIDLINALLWLGSAIGMLIYFTKQMGGRTRFTGRATV
jgi:hypothetical protein